MAEINWK